MEYAYVVLPQCGGFLLLKHTMTSSRLSRPLLVFPGSHRCSSCPVAEHGPKPRSFLGLPVDVEAIRQRWGTTRRPGPTPPSPPPPPRFAISPRLLLPMSLLNSSVCSALADFMRAFGWILGAFVEQFTVLMSQWRFCNLATLFKSI